MDFYNILDEVQDAKGQTYMPYAGKMDDGTWIEGTISIDFLNANFGNFTTATEMKNATQSEGLQLFFDWLVEQGKLPA
jgi:hypothetical protein